MLWRGNIGRAGMGAKAGFSFLLYIVRVRGGTRWQEHVLDDEVQVGVCLADGTAHFF